jgi:hypothetical protein
MIRESMEQCNGLCGWLWRESAMKEIAAICTLKYSIVWTEHYCTLATNSFVTFSILQD